ncbi:flagellar hook-basal body complex protein FliE [Candidatus Formimonas warabiya]|uniref:Flagellar hook-basal body complex protein FliE n=1 Tax=Formimonas warabiya TaxID=1761012 RepID=A0A3G1KTB0_FORW1|nr:flagellar hook-basal body complex protein FliE [Candidatus Formimonas warabiya]ATW25667.1 flagellar hook-basal body complex protein FliE [Candidatus Formimonas warabiya]
MEISGVASQPLFGIKTEEKKTPSVTESFADALSRMLNQVEQDQVNADQLSRKLLTGSVEDIHQVTFAMEQARLSLEMAVEVRNKLVDGYQEIMRMQV